MPIDTLAIAKMLEAAGTPQKQAEAHARVWGEVINQNLATKTDIEKLSKDTQTEIENLRKDTLIQTTKIMADISNIKADIFKWALPIVIGQFGAIVGAVAWLLKNTGH